MGRKSTIKRLEPDQRKLIDKLVREDRLTLDELIAELRRKFPSDKTPSRSALHRYKGSVEEMMKQAREIDTAATIMVTELGESFDEKAGTFLAQAITTLATHAAMQATKPGAQLPIKDLAALARAARNAADTRTITLKERQAIARDARDKLMREQEANLKTAEKAGRFDPETLRKIREDIYGVRG